MMLDRLLKRVILRGNVTLIDAFGRRHVFGDGSGAAVAFRLHDRALHRRLLMNPMLAFGEAWMDGTLTIEEGSLSDLLTVLQGNIGDGKISGPVHFIYMLRLLWRRFFQRNSIGRAQRNVAHHYDLDGGLYELFLDSDRQYSCAYYPDADTSLEEAQHAKKVHIAAKLRLCPGQTVLDIGCGWGGMAIYLARETGAHVTGITLSRHQHDIARQRVRDAGLEDQVDIRIQDYRDVRGTFDRIVSVGMFEHVGVRHYRDYFCALESLLKEDGIALLHSIGRTTPPGVTNAWVAKYIFPGGYIPSLSEVLPSVEESGLIVTDVEILRLHYAETLAEWGRRFAANRDRAVQIYDERFCRLWEFYLAGAEGSFRVGDMMNFQMQLSRRQEAVPLTRDYITDWERDQTRLSTASVDELADTKPRITRPAPAPETASAVSIHKAGKVSVE